jgi:hypothetical protein
MTAAITRLRSLPEAFTFAGFCKMTRFSRNAAAVCLRRWKTKGLIEAAGDRAGIYFNKLKVPEVDSSYRISALLFEYPSAILCGESVLHAQGWITQIPARLSVAVLSRPSYVSLHGFEIHGRPLSWFKKVHAAINSVDNARVYGLRALPPALALTDLYGDPKAWHPDIDDLDIPAEQASAILSASQLLSVDLPPALKNELENSEQVCHAIGTDAR